MNPENDSQVIKFAKTVGIGWQVLHSYFINDSGPSVYYLCDKCGFKIYAGDRLPLSKNVLEFVKKHVKCKPTVKNWTVFEIVQKFGYTRPYEIENQLKN